MEILNDVGSNNEVNTQTITDLKALEKKVIGMLTLNCGHLHENRDRVKDNSLLVLKDDGSVFCPMERRINNPACAHGMALESRQKILDLHPDLIDAMSTYIDTLGDKSELRLVNPFGVEFIQARKLGVNFTEEAIKKLFQGANDITTQRKYRNLMYENAKFRTLRDNLQSRLYLISQSVNTESIDSIFTKRYFPCLRKAIQQLDIIAAEASKEKCYDFNEMQAMQMIIIELLNELQSFLVTGINNHIKELQNK